MASPCYCVVCAVRLQFKIFWQGYIKKIWKIYGSPTGIPTDYNPSVFYRELQNNLWDCATFTDGFPTAFPTANTDGITDGLSHILKRTHVWHVSVWVNTDGQYRRIVAHPEAHACLTRVRLHEYRRLCRCQIPTESPTAYACLTRVRLHEYRWIFRRICRRIEKFCGIFELFWCAFQLIADGITDRI
jgi:hypothetical protein